MKTSSDKENTEVEPKPPIVKNRGDVDTQALRPTEAPATPQNTKSSDQITEDVKLKITDENRDAEAQYKLGLNYYKGDGVTKDYSEALKWFRKAADLGHAPAQFNIGEMYFEGRGVSRDYPEALKWYRKAADQGDATAQGHIGLMYLTGTGVTQDYTEAEKWFRKATDQGNEDARRLMEKLESEMPAKAQTNRPNCRITDGTLGFRDKEAWNATYVAEVHRQFSGDFEPLRKQVDKLLAEGRLVNLEKDEKAELLKVDQKHGQSIMHIRIPGKGVMWVDGTDLECR